VGEYVASPAVSGTPPSAPALPEARAEGEAFALLRGAAAACTGWERVTTDDAPVENLAEHVEALCQAARQALDGEEPRFRVLEAQVPMRRLLEALRRGFLDEVAKVPGAASLEGVLRIMCALEEVQGVLDRDCAQRFVSRFSGADALDLVVEVSHDMRSPLASILFLVETLRNGQSGAINAVQERQLGLVYSAAFGLSSMASDVIELARGGDRLVDAHPIPFSVVESFQSVYDIVLPMAEEKGLLVRTIVPEADFRIGHPAALTRVLLNLTTNALKFTTKGFVEVIGKQVTRTRVEFSVRDTGRGIPPQVMSTLFDTFRRRQKAGEYTFSSAGLGLSICRKLVEAMGGELRVETELEAGTRFSFELELPHASKL
jgi:signal transduction histidine kinase